MTIGPQGITVEAAHAHLEWKMQLGHGKDLLALDRRGLEHLLEKHMPTRGFRIPPDEEQHGGGRVYLGLAF